MNDMRIFSLYLKREAFLFFLLLIFLSFLLGCGGEGPPAADRLSGPAADEALPIRIDATVTPTFTPTPESENGSEDIPSVDAIQTPTIAVPDGELLTPIATPTSSEESSDPETSDDEILPDPSPVPTPTPSPTEEPSFSPEEKSKKTLKNPGKQSGSTTPSQEDEDAQDIEQEEPESEEPESQDDETQPDEPEEESDVSSGTSANIILDQLEVCAKVSNREPVNIATQFSLSQVGKVYTWMQVSDVKPPKVVKHIYYREGKVIARVSLKLKYASMRTWSQKTFKPGESVGKWKVVVTTENEKEVLAVKEFTVVP